MKACWSGFMAIPLTPNWMVSFCFGVSIWNMGSRKSSLVTMPASFSFERITRQEMFWVCIFWAASFRVVSGVTVITGWVIMPLAGMLRTGTFSPTISPRVWRCFGWKICSMMSCMLIMPASFPFSMIGTWETPCSRKRLSTAPTDLSASITWGALVIILSMVVLPHSSVTAPWMMSSSVTNPMSLFFSKTGSCLMPLSIISLAVLPRLNSGETLGADRIRVLTFVFSGSGLDLIIHRLEMTPWYLPFWFTTAITGGISFLKISKHLDMGSFILTVKKFFVNTFRTGMALINFTSSSFRVRWNLNIASCLFSRVVSCDGSSGVFFYGKISLFYRLQMSFIEKYIIVLDKLYRCFILRGLNKTVLKDKGVRRA